MAERQLARRNALANVPEGLQEIFQRLGLERPAEKPSVDPHDMNPHLFNAELPQHKIIMIPAQGTQSSSRATLSRAFPYLPTASKLAIMYRLGGILRMLDILHNRIHNYLLALKKIKDPDANPEYRFFLHELKHIYNTRVHTFFDFVRDNIEQDVEALDLAERVRTERNATYDRNSYFAAGYGPAAHAFRTRQRLNDIGTLILQVFPQRIEELRLRTPVMYTPEIRHQPMTIKIFFIRELIEKMLHDSAVPFLEGIDKLKEMMAEEAGEDSAEGVVDTDVIEDI